MMHELFTEEKKTIHDFIIINSIIVENGGAKPPLQNFIGALKWFICVPKEQAGLADRHERLTST